MIHNVHLQNKETTHQREIAESSFLQQQKYEHAAEHKHDHVEHKTDHVEHKTDHHVEHEHKKKKILKKKKKIHLSVEEKKSRKHERIFLFAADTITHDNQKIAHDMEQFLFELRKKEHVAIVFRSPIEQQKITLGEHLLTDWDYVFSENGLVVHKDGSHFITKTLVEHLGEDQLKTFINFCLHYLADLDLPVKRGSFIELYNGSLNISPIGRSSNQKERQIFTDYDQKNNIRDKFVAALEEKFKSYNLKYTMSDTISFDVAPDGWDTSYCIQHLVSDKFSTIHFFGVKTTKGELDHQIFSDKRIIGHTVTSPDDTRKQVDGL